MASEERNARARRRLVEPALAALLVSAVGVACSGSTFTGTDPEAGASGAAGSGGSSAGKGGRGGAGGKAGSSSGVGGATGGSAGKGSGGTDSTGGTDSSGGTGKGGTAGSTGGTDATGGTGDGGTGGGGGSGNDSGNGGSGNASGDGGTGNTSGQGGSSAGSGGAGNASGQGGSTGGTAGQGGGAGGTGGTLGGTGGTLGGIGGSGNAAGTGGRAGAECQTASDCQMQTDCCTCAAEPKGKLLPACQSVCVVDRCTSMQIGPSEVACVRGRCVIARSCDLSQVTCDEAEPACAMGTIPSVDETCFGPCLPPTDCSSVTSCADCASGGVCVRNEAQLPSYGCVVPVLGCQAGSYCSCLGACMSPFNACMETSVQVNCSCPNC